MPSTIGVRSAPETRTMPMPPRPGGVAIAAMTSVSADLDTRSVRQEAARGGRRLEFTASASRSRHRHRLTTFLITALVSLPSLGGGDSGLPLQHAVHMPLLENLQRVVDQPVEHQA